MPTDDAVGMQRLVERCEAPLELTVAAREPTKDERDRDHEDDEHRDPEVLAVRPPDVVVDGADVGEVPTVDGFRYPCAPSSTGRVDSGSIGSGMWWRITPFVIVEQPGPVGRTYLACRRRLAPGHRRRHPLAAGAIITPDGDRSERDAALAGEHSASRRLLRSRRQSFRGSPPDNFVRCSPVTRTEL